MEQYDVLIIGAGVIGTSIARELSAYKLKTAVIEKEADVCFGTSSRNSGVVHSGIHYTPGSLRAKHGVKGNEMFEELCSGLQVPFQKIGKLTVAFDESQFATLASLYAQGIENQVPDLQIIDEKQMQELQPGVGGKKALYSPTTGITGPYELTIALAEHAHAQGVEFFFTEEVTSLEKSADRYILKTQKGTRLSGKIIINAAGLYSDAIARMAGIDEYTIYPCRGEYYVLDKRLQDELQLLIYPVPGHHSSGLGIHLTNTVEGNILIGPSNEYSESRDELGTTLAVLAELRKEGHALLPSLTSHDLIRSFAGLRPKLTPPEVGGFSDFIIEDHDRFILLTGIESPGLTASPSIAVTVRELVEKHLPLIYKEEWEPTLTRERRFLELPQQRQKELIQQDPDYGSIICRCEGITKAEVLHAVDRIIGPVTYIGIKLRCRAMMGRCQGGFCTPRIAELLKKERGINIDEQFYKGLDSPMFEGTLRGEGAHD